MDRRLIFPGGEINPTNDELNLMPDSNRRGLEAGVAKGIARGANYIIDGLNFTVNPGVAAFILNDGHVVLDGEILEIETQTVPAVPGHVAFVIEKQTVTNDPDYERNYRDGSTHNVAEFNRAVVVSVTSIADPDGDLVLNTAEEVTSTENTLFLSTAFTPMFTGYVGPFTVGSFDASVDFGGDVVSIVSFANASAATRFEVEWPNTYDITKADTFVRLHLQISGPNFPTVGGGLSYELEIATGNVEVYVPSSYQIPDTTVKVWIEHMATRKRQSNF